MREDAAATVRKGGVVEGVDLLVAAAVDMVAVVVVVEHAVTGTSSNGPGAVIVS